MALGWFSPFISDSRFTILCGKGGSRPRAAIATRPPENSHSFSPITPVSRSASDNFWKEKSGTRFKKRMPRDSRHRSRLRLSRSYRVMSRLLEVFMLSPTTL